MSTADGDLRLGYLPGVDVDIHLSVFTPGQGPGGAAWVVHIPAFAEEMNKSRAMVARQARAFAAAGVTTVVPDFCGAGESGGPLQNASWGAWRDQIVAVVAWVRRQGCRHLTLWAHRHGALILPAVIERLTLPPEQLLLWQPHYQGKQAMPQFLRLRMAAGLAGGSRESVASLRETLAEQGSLEVAGYTVPLGLYQDMESARLADLSVPPGTRVGLFEVADSPGASRPVSSRYAESLSGAGVDCTLGSVQGPPFWTTQELGFCPELIEDTTAWYTADHRLKGAAAEAVPIDLRGASESGVRPLVFPCAGQQLAGALHDCDAAAPGLGVVIVVGGPQFRSGSHRQFVYLAEVLAQSGIPCLRFDYRGMGDSGGELRGFDYIEDDIRAAIDALLRERPGIDRVALWGLCDAATAAMFYAPGDARVKALVLANPWVYSEAGEAQSYLRHYYWRRLLQAGFWRKLLAGKFDVRGSLGSMGELFVTAFSRGGAGAGSEESPSDGPTPTGSSQADLVTRFADALARYPGAVDIALSGVDLTAAEFADACKRNRRLRRLVSGGRVRLTPVAAADHTFSRAEWRGQIEAFSVRCVTAAMRD